MSVRELKRAAVLARVRSGDLTLRHASELMGVSYRQAKRLWTRFRQRGAIGLRHRSVGRRSHRRKPAAFRRKVLGVVRREFGGDATHERFGPTLAAEHLREEFKLVIHHETLRRWMLTARLWSRVRDAPAHRKRRERKAHFGELVQLDGSFEAWLEDRGPTACLMDLVDDATGTCGLRFEAQETTWGAVRSLRAWIAVYGIPLALYTDWKNVYVRKPTEAEIGAGEIGLTQFGRMCATLGIRIIAASSPQAKGRVERGHGTHQDRLIKKLRRKRMATYDAANGYLTSHYIPDHNRRFARPPAAPENFHTPVPPGLDLDEVFRVETERTVSNDWVVRHDNHLLQLERRGRHYPPARSTVRVCEYADGHLDVWYGGQRVPWTEVAGRPVTAAPRPASRAITGLPRPPAADHPWRRSYRELPDGRPRHEEIPTRRRAGRPAEAAASAGPAVGWGAGSAASTSP
jgi:transposase